MSRSTLRQADLKKGLSFENGHFGLYHLNTKVGGAREMLCRLSAETVACKALPIVVDPTMADKIKLRGRCKRTAFAREMLKRKLHIKAEIPILATDRPVTYFPGRQLKENFIYELPGGVVEDSERFSVGGVREMLEELGICKKQVLCFTCLMKPRAFDSGSHAEWVGIVAAICTGEIKPPSEEGIIPEECRTTTLSEIDSFIRKADKNGIGVEGYLETACNRLLLEMSRVKD